MDKRRIGIESWIVNDLSLKSKFNHILKKDLSNLPVYEKVYLGNCIDDAIIHVNKSLFNLFIIQIRDKNNLFNERKTMDIDKNECIEYIKSNSFENCIIYIREFFNAEYSGTIRANSNGIIIELWKGNHMLNDTKTANETFYGVYKNISFKWYNCTCVEKNIMLNALKYFTTLNRENIENLKFYAEFIFNKKYVFIDYSTHDFWTDS